ncbi:16S rRNA (adenine(1518)-N(6)/adenine(1519)-N(6))-dimethyltransferaseRsmA [soil metagenome]
MSDLFGLELPELPSSVRGWKELIESIDVRPSKGKGQNFLFERGVVQRIVRAAEVGETSTIVEIGPGLGILTWELLATGASVTSVELDWRLAQYLNSFFAGVSRFHLIEGDALHVPFDSVLPDGDYDVVANLPYSVGTAIIQRFLEAEHPPRAMTVMVQKEVAERLVAPTPDMSILSVATQFLSNPKISFIVPPTVFIPPPRVDSAVIRLETRTPELAREIWPIFFRIVNAGFHQKRKNLGNSLSHALDLPKPAVIAWLDGAEIDPGRRAETLSVTEWVVLTNMREAVGL